MLPRVTLSKGWPSTRLLCPQHWRSSPSRTDAIQVQLHQARRTLPAQQNVGTCDPDVLRFWQVELLLETGDAFARRALEMGMTVDMAAT